MALQRDREEELEALLNRGSLWAITYGDLMSFLMIFFLILFAMAIKGRAGMAEGLGALQRQFGGERTSSALQRLEDRSRELAVADDLKTKLYGRGQQEFVTVNVTEQRILVTMPDPILFDSGAAALKAQAHPFLAEFSEIVKTLPNNIVVEGHTDDRAVRGGRFASNWELSMARAASVVGYLVREQGLDPRRVSGAGFAEFRPVASNDTPEGRAANRRIEISMLRRE
ncbi:MAG: flagellar motor protein MotB [Elusimicrobia bacterium]|nr:flagellar motor protein MotB [Elusimicrobiota bacterium]